MQGDVNSWVDWETRSLFGDADPVRNAPPSPPEYERDSLRREFAVLGFLCDRHPMEFLTFKDETGIVETTFFPQTYHHFSHMLDCERPYLLTGKVEEDWGAIILTVDRVETIQH